MNRVCNTCEVDVNDIANLSFVSLVQVSTTAIFADTTILRALYS